MKRSAALIATLMLLVTAVYLGRGAAIRREAAASPTGCLERMFLAAEKGDVPAYLDCFTGPQRERLAREAATQSADDFAASLKDALRTLKGRAISGPSGTQPPADRATLSVERIYTQHTERQSYHFVRDADGWRIEAVGGVEKRQPPIPYGTPVFELTPASEDEGK